jgi:uncharacterized membrane protein YhiD involved in acid resistance
MPEWLTPALSTDGSNSDLFSMALRLVGAGIAGWMVALIATHGMSRGSDRTLPLTLILMSILIAMATQIIGDNVARAFSLVGALSIVRFRTAVPDSRDVAFVLASVVIGMAVGAGQWAIAGYGLMVVGAVNQISTRVTNSVPGSQFARTKSKLCITTEATVGPVSDEKLQSICRDFGLISATTTRKGAAMTYVYQIRLHPEVRPDAMLFELKKSAGVESVSWSQNFDRDE